MIVYDDTHVRASRKSVSDTRVLFIQKDILIIYLQIIQLAPRKRQHNYLLNSSTIIPFINQLNILFKPVLKVAQQPKQ